MRRSILILAFLISLCSHLVAQQLTEAQIRQKIWEVAVATKSLQCDFVQTKYMKILNDKMVSKGVMYYQTGNHLRWEYLSPYTYIFLMNDDKVLLKNKHRNDVIDVNQNKIFKEIARIMMNSVVGNSLNDDKSYKASIVASKGEWVATLIPLRKEMKQFFQRIILHFNPKQAFVSQVELVEKNGDKTMIDLKNVKKNEKINSAVFAVH